MRERIIKQCVVVSLLLTIVLAGAELLRAQDDSAVKRSIVGVWLGQLQRRDCTSNNPMGPPSPGIISFQKGGTASSASTLPTAQPPLPTPFLQTSGYGVWEQLNAFNYTVAIVSMKLNSDGTFGNYTKLRGSISLSDSGDQFTWVGTGEFVTADGTVLMTTCNTINANRFE